LFTAVVTIVVAIVGAVIAWGQFSLARMRMQHDLYDRRYKMFESTRRLIAEIVREGRSTNQHVLTYLRETGDAVFLLDRSTVDYMKELEEQARRLAFLGTILATDDHPNRNAAIDEEAELLQWFTDQFEVLIDKFKPFLQLNRPWWRW
jgi:hypothetical protein